MFQPVVTELASQAESFQELRVIEEGNRPAVQAVGHKTALQFKDASFITTGAIERKLSRSFLGRFLHHLGPHNSSLSGVPGAWATAA